MLYALVKGTNFAKACQEGSAGVVHSVFERAINLKLPQGQLLTVLYQDIDIMEAVCTVAFKDKPLNTLAKVGDKVVFTPKVMYVTSIPVVVGIDKAATWQSLTGWEGINKLSYKEIILKCNEINSFLDRHDSGKMLWPAGIKLFKAEEYIGLGEGLTPAGDDFLAGMLYGMWFLQQLYHKRAPFLAETLKKVSKNIHKTGEISRHFLKYAINNKPGFNTENFLLAIFNKNERQLTKALYKKLHYGASSGLDELKGCLFGLKETAVAWEEELCT
ncbi:MAG: DUF2877 domain-containing protein [Spirochaetaceae bacterium]|nr:DUF2877 domain-containing protein [Spirochaetaceae bacterium]